MAQSAPDAARQLNKATVSSAYALFMLMLAEERGIDGGRILAGSGVERERLAQPDARITPLQQAVIVFNLLEATGDPSIAIEIGLRSSLTKAGLIGFGLMSCATLGEAIALGIRYLPTRVPFFSVRLAQLDGIVDIDVLEAFPLGRLRQFAVENFLVETAILFNSLLYPVPGRTLRSRAELHFEWPEPPWFERYRARLPRCHFDASANRIRCDAALLNEPIGTANAHTAQMIVQQCEAELARLGYAESIVERVRNLLICGERGYPSVDDVARELHVSARTLKRKLAEYGATYSALLDEIRLRDALRLLEGTRLPVDEIAARVGYTDRANFTRAFKRWTGVAPSERR
ncbi:AraC family transcriptional regulator [Burkholderia metallica]|uniref:AraC family transcriptional regulator n=1 Tax=Burkholderia metallica TaxID=488729 RepID=UPI001454745C|nr:AraC family transcriptional regulator [Burkholderia metallica]VWC07939.1 AraC family transcriptional regulator [Burkholderia metallica]